jgi:hypothetical protein
MWNGLDWGETVLQKRSGSEKRGQVQFSGWPGGHGADPAQKLNPRFCGDFKR